MIYYAIQNRDTGEYWRGKGSANRWGKYFNQASIYRIKGQASNTLKDMVLRNKTLNVHIVELSIEQIGEVNSGR